MESEDDYQEALECSKCGQSVEEILALQCVHNLCLVCASKTLQYQQHYEGGVPQHIANSLKCEICGVVTLLEQSSAQVLRELLNTRNSSPDQKAPTKRTYYSPTPPQHPNAATNGNFQQPERSSQMAHPLKESLNTVVAAQEQGSLPDTSIVCRDHPSEEAILYCYTCETPCICVECCLNGLHKGHDLRNVLKNYEALGGSVEELRFKLRTRTDVLLNDESRLTQKKREMVEVVAQAKSHIKASFDELAQVLENKQKELLLATEELMEEKFSDIDRCLQKVRSNMKILQDYDYKLDALYSAGLGSSHNNNNIGGGGISNSSSAALLHMSAEQQIRAYNYYADNKQKMLQNMHEMDVSFFQLVQERMQTEFALDLQTLYQHIDSVRLIKFETIALRGLESVTPNNFESTFYERAREDRNRRRFTTKSQQNNSNNNISVRRGEEEDTQEQDSPERFQAQNQSSAAAMHQQNLSLLRESKAQPDPHSRQNETFSQPREFNELQKKIETHNLPDKKPRAARDKENVTVNQRREINRTQEKIAELRKVFANQ